MNILQYIIHIIVGNFGKVFNLVNWQNLVKITKLQFRLMHACLYIWGYGFRQPNFNFANANINCEPFHQKFYPRQSYLLYSITQTIFRKAIYCVCMHAANTAAGH